MRQHHGLLLFLALSATAVASAAPAESTAPAAAGMPPGAVFQGVPGAMRVPPLQVPRPLPPVQMPPVQIPPVPVPQGVPTPGALPYQPDGAPNPDDGSGKSRM